MRHGRMFYLALLCCVSVPLRADFISFMRTNDVSAYSIFGYRWGWEGDRKLSSTEVEELLAQNKKAREEEKELRRQARAQEKELRERLKGDRKAMKKALKEMRASGGVSSSRDGVQSTVSLTVREQYKRMGNEPESMIYQERASYLWGLISHDRTVRTDVRWSDAAGVDTIAVHNGTDQQLFIEEGADPAFFSWTKHKKLYGVASGHARWINRPESGRIGVWKRQMANEPVNELFEVIRIPQGVSQLEVREGEGSMCIKVIQ